MLSVVLASLLLLELSHIASCWSYVDRSLGTLPVQVGLRQRDARGAGRMAWHARRR